MDEIEWLNTDEAAKRLGITTRTLYRFMDQGRLPSYRFGRVFRLKTSDIELFIEDCRVEPGTLSHLYPEPNPAEADDGEQSSDGTPGNTDTNEEG
ncbi:MAG: helix-turn-helix domain-containing protein [Acidimicrobiaceae bacterium]|nr:helix-turn-helix domain-containing protein [Acidimicrobiaceae bacterium]MDB4103256.1 helix-turn-helix domain-containing protein [Acidimicrobiales bacterium]MDC1390056.1 helix-turn-helix domain-containing protein [Acidimicrobiales bacterium]MDG1086129.1 helix-turn-helix domain-containing protein [Acidimicrobiales bacterium]